MAEFKAGARGKCPSCQTVVKFESAADGTDAVQLRSEKDSFSILPAACPHCGKFTLALDELRRTGQGGFVVTSRHIIWPRLSARAPAPEEVPQGIASDFNEAAQVLSISAKASAALSRRAVQAVLRGAGNTKARDLSDQIDEVLPSLPGYIAENLDAIRNIGNFAAHEQKSKSSGAILDVEPGEAEWNLEVLEALFDFYYVKPSVERAKREALNKKLEEAGKPQLKQPSSETDS